MITDRLDSMTTHYALRTCPICQAAELRPRVICSSPRAEDSEFEILHEQWNKDIFNDKIFFSYGRCDSCGLLYCPTYLNEHQLKQLYGAMEPNMAELPEECLRSTQRAYLRTAVRYNPPHGNVIEVGPDRGILAHEICSLPQFQKFWFLEPNTFVHPQLRDSVHPKESEITADLNRMDHIPDATVSLAFMVHVLDHLANPMHHLKEMYRCLKPGGILSIVVHNERSLLARLFGARFPIFCPYHPQLFNPTTLGKALGHAGFRKCVISRTINYFPLGYLAKNAAFRAGLNGSWIPMLRGTAMPLPLGNIQAVATK
jgi:SAM-dependent methyltransferase